MKPQFGIRSKTFPLVIAGQEYGTGSSRDWAAKGQAPRGKSGHRASFERIHRSNLVGMGYCCQFLEGMSATSLGLTGAELFSQGIGRGIAPRQTLSLLIKYPSGEEKEVPVLVRIDTPIEVDYYRHGGILSYVLRQLSQ